MRKLKKLFDNNQEWVKAMNKKDPEFFSTLAKQQKPEILWIGCADSRVPANQIVDLLPGDLFVHRNVANVVVHSDLNCLSVLQYAVEVLQVKHVIVCGHYRCGGVMAALTEDRVGIVENWIGHIVDIKNKYKDLVAAKGSQQEQADLLCELNVVEQVVNVCSTTIVKDAWKKGADLAVHGWIYDVADGLLKDLSVCIDCNDNVDDMRAEAVKSLTQ